MSKINSLYGYEIADANARERLDALDGGGPRTSWQESGDLYDLLKAAEIPSMALEGKRLFNNDGTYIAQTYSNNTIRFFDKNLIGYERLIIRNKTIVFSAFCYYDPDDESYTLIKAPSGGNNSGMFLSLSGIPEGCYLCTSCANSNWTTGKSLWMGRIWINPNYTPKFPGLDESITDKPIPVELLAVDNSGYPYFCIDLERFADCVVRLQVNSGPNATMGTYYSDTPNGMSGSAGTFAYNNFLPWVNQKKYLIFFWRTNDVFTTPINISFGWIDPEVARTQKQRHYWGPDIAVHNADTMTELVHACVYADIVDIDLCRTLDGYYVGIHATSINGHTIAETNLADLDLTYDQFEFSRALEVLKKYGTYCVINFRQTTLEQQAELSNRIYNVLGRACVYEEGFVNQNSPLYGHMNKFYAWKNEYTIADVIAAGAKIEKTYASVNATDETYTAYDWITTQVVNATSANDIIKDGSCAVCLIYTGTTAILNGDLS